MVSGFWGLIAYEAQRISMISQVKWIKWGRYICDGARCMIDVCVYECSCECSLYLSSSPFTLAFVKISTPPLSHTVLDSLGFPWLGRHRTQGLLLSLTTYSWSRPTHLFLSPIVEANFNGGSGFQNPPPALLVSFRNPHLKGVNIQVLIQRISSSLTRRRRARSSRWTVYFMRFQDIDICQVSPPLIWHTVIFISHHVVEIYLNKNKIYLHSRKLLPNRLFGFYKL